ncbi:hypothetical protein Aperf_G00000081625 [Anoplocephala perfoliata]
MEVQVEYDYTAEERDELTLKQGDIVTNVSQFEEGWYIGTFNGREGVFPDNFVKILKPATSKNNHSKSSSDQNDRSGNIPLSGPSSALRGSGPDRAVENGKNQALSPTPSTPSTTVSTNPSDYVKVAYGYTPEQPDELELEVKDFIRVLSRDLPEEGWWRGVNLRTNKTGVFPDNFVKMADAADPDFKRAIADLKAKGTSSFQRTQNVPSSARTAQGDPSGLSGSKRYESSSSKTDSGRRNDVSDGGHADRRSQKAPAANVNPNSMPRTADGRPVGKSESTRLGRGETSGQKTNGAFSSLGRKSSESSARAISDKSRSSSLSRIDPNRMSETTPRNINDLQHIVNEQKKRLSALAGQLENLGQIVETLRREQREQADEVAGQLHEFNRQLSALKSSQMSSQSSLGKNLKQITERIRTIMTELDAVKKTQADNQVDMDRIKKIVLDIDSRTMLSGMSINGAGEDYDTRLAVVKDTNNHHNSGGDPYPPSRSFGSSFPASS